MRKFLFSVAIGALAATGAMADTFSGTISDSMCGAKHTAATEKDASCVQSCLKKGAKPVLLSDGKVLKLSADSESKVADFAGKKVSVTGTVDGDTVTIQEVKAAE